MRTMRNLSVLILVVGAFFTIAGNAFAFCGPGFSNKAQAVAYYKTSAGAKFLPSLKTHLVADGFMSADQDVLAFFESDKTANVITPKGYTLSKNTSCKGSQYGPYAGLLLHSDKNVLAVIVGKTVHPIGNAKVVSTKTTKVKTVQSQVNQPDGSIKVYETTTYRETVTLQKKSTACVLYKPLEKGYCRNYVGGPVFTKCETKVVSYTQSKTYTKVVLVKTTPPPAIPTPTAPTPVPTPVPAPKAICTINGVPQYVQPPNTIINVQGECVAQQQTQVVCQGNQTTIYNSQGIAVSCQDQQQQQTQNNNQTVNVTVDVPAQPCVAPNTVVNGVCTAPPSPVQYHPSLSLSQSKSDNFTAVISVGSDVPQSITVNWGDGPSATVSGSSATHKYPTPPAGPAGNGVTYSIVVTAHYGDGPDVTFAAQSFFVAAPAPDGGTTTPPAP